MEKVDVLELAELVNAQSLTGELAEHLLNTNGVLYEAAEETNKFRRLLQNGEVSEGYFQSGVFVNEKVVACLPVTE